MADPLTQVTEQFAPAPLNFFDQDRAQSIIARHADSRRGLESANAALATVGQAEQLANTRAREERQALLQTREDREYADKLANREDRSSFFDDLDEFDHTATDANVKLTETLKDIAKNTPTLLEDPVAKEFIERKFRQIDKAEAQRNQEKEIKLRQKNTLEGIKERAKYQETLKYLKPEDIEAAPKDEAGNRDQMWLGMKAKEREREAEVQDYGKKADIATEKRRELYELDKMDDAQKAVFKETEKFVIGNKAAFPDRMDAVRQKALSEKNPPELVADEKMLAKIPGYAAAVQEAKEWDADKFENEVRTAKDADTLEDYLTFNGPDGKPVKLTPKAKAARKKVWEYAHQNDAAEAALEGKKEPAAPKPTTPKPLAPKSETPAPVGTTKVINGVTYVERDGKVYKVK